MIDPEKIIQILTIVLIVMIVSFIIFLVVFFIVKMKEKQRNVEKNKEIIKDKNSEKQKETQKAEKEIYSKRSIFNFMEFDKIEDNMIIQKSGERYLMVVECQGINYDLMSEQEQVAVEAGFCQFLNTLRYSIQIYVQTRNVNLNESIKLYKNRLKDIENELNKKRIQYQNMKNSTQDKEEKNKAFFELTRISNLYEYGQDIIYNTERMSTNKNVLSKRYYIIIPFYSSEISEGDYQKEEIQNMAFSGLYSKAQSIIRAISACGVNSKILDSVDLVELLYYAYNRDEASLGDLSNKLYEYEDVYSTATDVLDKKIKLLNKRIEKEALELAKRKTIQAQSKKQQELEEKEANIQNLIDKLAIDIINSNQDFIGEDIANMAKEEIHKDNKSSKRKRRTAKNKNEEEVEDVKETTRKTTRKRE